ncbi:hypothetical protein B0H17DRAFT_1192448 [Mycena rosella]|uniref:Uncharacterized protein n=1 Tax=Mycena rosella TaxID=1033263 RepID=A0AAD7M9S7_MYCRO|nr:hypothetical protein B0H17DRAFT_1192448 [Mycena rosella]
MRDWMRTRKRAREVCQLVRVPRAFIEERKREITEELKRNKSSESAFSSDVLLAWWFKTSYGLRRSDDDRGVALHVATNLRPKRIFAGPYPTVLATQPYINNASSTISVPPLNAHAFRTIPLRELALRIRKAVPEYDHADSLHACEHELRWLNVCPMARIVHCPSWAEKEVQTTYCGLKHLDFSGAGYVGGEKETPRAPEEGESLRGDGAILMEDADAIWMSQVKWREEWEELRKSGRFKFI